MTRVFPFAVAVLEGAGGLVYLWHRQWTLAGVWCFYSAAAFCLARLG